MSRTIAGLIGCSLGILLGSPLSAIVEFKAAFIELSVTDTLFVTATSPCDTQIPGDSPEWSIDPGDGGSASFESSDPAMDSISWAVSWSTAGFKQIVVSVDTGQCQDSGSLMITVNTCVFSMDTFAGGEGDGTIQVTIDRAPGFDSYLACQLAVVGGTATLDEDYSDPSDVFFWAPGTSAPIPVPIPVLDNDLVEATETIELELIPFTKGGDAEGTGRVAQRIRIPALGSIATDTATVEIADDDFASVSFQTSGATVSEAEGEVQLDLVRSGADGAFEVAVAEAGGTASPSEYGFFPSLVSFGPTDTTKTVTFFAFLDDETEPDETAVLELVSPTNGVTVGSTPQTMVVIQDSGTCQLTAETYTVEEDAGAAQVLVERIGGTAGAVQCQLLAVGGEGPTSATPGVDFLPVDQIVGWNDQEGGAKGVAVPILDDTNAEGTELIQLELLGYVFDGALADAARADGSGRMRVARQGVPLLDAGVIEIIDDDGVLPTTLSFVAPSSQVTEGQAPHTIQVARSGDTTGAVTVDVVVAGGDAAPTDYTVASPVALSWASGEGGEREFQVTALADALAEPSETVTFQLANAQRPGFDPPLLIAPSAHELTIVNVADSGTVRFTAATFPGAEGGGTVEIGVVRELGSAGAVSVGVCFLEGSTEPEDVVLPASTTLQWANGESGVQSLVLGIVDDTAIEGTETLPIELCDPSAALTVSAPSAATVAIADNDFETSEEIVIAGAAGGPEDPIVVYGRDGRKIVVWVAFDGTGLGIYCQIFDPEGDPIGSPFLVNESSAGSSTQPSAVVRDDGSIVIVWRQSGGDGAGYSDGRLPSLAGSSDSVVARGFSPTGSSSGSETVVSSSTSGDSQKPEVGTDRDGELTITWQQGGNVKGQTLSQNLAPRTPVIDVSSIPGASDPDVAVSASGDFVVVWKQEPGTGDGTILVQAFDDDGTPMGEGAVVSQNAQADSPAVATDDQGNFFVVFTEPADAIDVFGRLFDRRGTRRGPKVRINVVTAGNQTQPNVDMNSIGDIAVVWQSDPAGEPGAATAGSGGSIVSRFFNPQGEAQSGDVQVAESEAGSTVEDPDVSIENEDETTVVFVRRGPDDEPEGIFSKLISPTLTSGPCTLDQETLCVQGEQRFRVLVEWQDFEGNSGEGQAVPLTGDTGYFWFFGPDNVEILLKVLDGCAINDRLWVFAGGLTNVEVNLRVDDVLAGITLTYFNTLGRSFQPIIDIDAFDTCDVAAPPPDEPSPADLPAALGTELEQWARALGAAAPSSSGSAGALCNGSETALCLRDQRFEATLLWESADAAGLGQPVPLSDGTGTFWFFQPDNVEAVVKVLDACAINGHYWVFAAGITDVATDLQVLDTQTSVSRQYTTDLGTPFVPVLDVRAFECP